MPNLLASLLSLEALAVVLALAYLLLAARQNLWCWLCALLSSLIYMWLMWQARLYMETVLNGFYAVMAVLGWHAWRQHSGQLQSASIVSLRPLQQGLCLALALALALINGYLLQRFTDAVFPFVDAFITWGSVITTFLVVRKVLQNWLYWLVLDGMALLIYLDRGLYLTALLFALYLVIVVIGYRQWQRDYLRDDQRTLTAFAR
jgi:nicotinamide mononucleotide transporter